MNNRWRTIKRYRKKHGIIYFLGIRLHRQKFKTCNANEIPQLEISKPEFTIEIEPRIIVDSDGNPIDDFPG